jgi:arylformamidase
MSTLIDISPLLHAHTPVWPGDVTFQRDIALDMKNGSNLTLSAIKTTLHIGAHGDAPSHYLKHGESIDTRDLIFYYGLCQIIEVTLPPQTRILPEHFQDLILAPRILFKTKSFNHNEPFQKGFNSLSPELISFLHHASVFTVGIDTPSVDPFEDAKLLSHCAIAERNMAILEGLELFHVKPGQYKLIALPLKIAQADASPLRAVLEML